MTAAVEDVEPQPIPKPRKPKKRAPEQHVELPKPDDVVSPYPEGVNFFEYKPKDGSPSILLAIDGFDTPDKLWHFDVAQLPMLAQRWAWLDRAKIPKDIQRQAHKLPDEEFLQMFNDWFEVMGKWRGAAKGAVTPGK